MKKNMGTIDRAVRVLVAAIIAVLYFLGVLPGVWAVILGVLAVVFIATSFVGTCPLYLPLGLSTAGKEES